MGTWAAALWSDGTASDVRATYREGLEDDLGDDEAVEKVLAEFAPDLADDDCASVVWLGSRMWLPSLMIFATTTQGGSASDRRGWWFR